MRDRYGIIGTAEREIALAKATAPREALWWFEGIKQGVAEHCSGLCRYCGEPILDHENGTCTPAALGTPGETT